MAHEKTETASFIAKAITYLVVVLPPVFVANLTHWAATVITGRKMSLRSRVAVFLGSFGIAAVVHWLCEIWGAGKYEWVFIWSSGMGTEQVLKFFYLEFGDIIKSWIKNQVTFLFKIIGK